MPGGFDSPGMRYAGLGIELAAAVGLMALLGWWVDGRFGTAPWGVLVGSLLGLAGGMANMVRVALGATRSGGDGGDGGTPAGGAGRGGS